jgi:hypothetical protein
MNNNSDPDVAWEDILKNFIALVIKTPVALITMGMSFFLGYGISFILFDYRKSKAAKSHYFFHLIIGLGYTALVFLVVNWKIINSDLTEEQLSKCMPLTLLISFAFAFISIVIISILRERKKPYTND